MLIFLCKKKYLIILYQFRLTNLRKLYKITFIFTDIKEIKVLLKYFIYKRNILVLLSTVKNERKLLLIKCLIARSV